MNSRVITRCILGVFCLAISCFTAVAQSPDAGKAIIARGDVIASQADASRELQRRDPVFLEDNVLTGVQSAAQLRMADGGLLSLQAETELAIANYEFDPDSLQGSVLMRLISGGLRTVTGKLQTGKDNYRLDTPLASIGVRGTHYEAELVEGDLYLAAWQGIIDVDVGASGVAPFSLGDGQAYRFAVVTKDYDVQFLLANPLAFSSGHSPLPGDELMTAFDTDYTLAYTIATGKAPESMVPALLVTGEAGIDTDRDATRYLEPDDRFAGRQGQAQFDAVENATVSSSLGSVENFAMSVTLDFDSARIPTGYLSFDDPGGEWFAAFNGVVKSNELDVTVNFASHNNELADGFIRALLIDSASAVAGNFELFEIRSPDIAAGGQFLLREQQ
ncbi:FecR family protein [Aestuariibacter salexigens]|uniref:FecR family protein n=1 Tax=Aestuariibacter salexigens TaxID=226010 RepID=UPI0003F7B575|nr:FecR family protein [Aestuariibacter salexigens]